MYAGIEALKLGYGGIKYIALLFECSRDTIYRGIKELGEDAVLPEERDRRVGGGRKPLLEKVADINEIFLDVLKEHTAVDPTDEKVKWTNLTVAQIIALLVKKGIKVSRNIVRKLLKKHGYARKGSARKGSGLAIKHCRYKARNGKRTGLENTKNPRVYRAW